MHELVERESMKPGPSSSQSSAAYVHGFSKAFTTAFALLRHPMLAFLHTQESCSNTVLPVGLSLDYTGFQPRCEGQPQWPVLFSICSRSSSMP